jgi:hypothetical protein
MGIEYIILNRDKKEFLDFDRLGFGTKIGSMTSELIAPFLSWLLINPEGYGVDIPEMMGRWAGDRIEIVGDEEAGWQQQERARREFKDITVETIHGFAAANPIERITKLQPMGLIDKDGNVIIDPERRGSIQKYWQEMEEKENKELNRYLAEQAAALNGGRGTSPDRSGANDGPPSVS